MTALGQILAGSRLTASAVQGIAPLAALKAVNETRANTTLANDDALVLQMAANASYFFVAFLVLTGAAISTGDLKGDFTWPAGASATWWSLGYATSGTTVNSNHAESTGAAPHGLGIDGANQSGALIMGTITNGSTAGPLQWQFAQNSSSATATTEHAGSILLGWQVG